MCAGFEQGKGHPGEGFSVCSITRGLIFPTRLFGKAAAQVGSCKNDGSFRNL